MKHLKNVIGNVSSLWRFPVKSMAGEKLDNISISKNGVVGDRAYALLDVASGKVVSAKTIKLFPDILYCSAEYVSELELNSSIPAVKITLPNGIQLRSDAEDLNDRLSEFFKRKVILISNAPDDFTIDQFHPDIEGLDPIGNQNITVPQKLGSALFASVGMNSPVPNGSFLDVFPISVITTSSLRKMKSLAPNSDFDARRFRMNIVIDTDDEGFVENSWVTSNLIFNEKSTISIAMLDPRCVMTTLGQPGLSNDLEVLKTLVKHNREMITGLGNYPCAGVYAEVRTEGNIALGDSVRVIN